VTEVSSALEAWFAGQLSADVRPWYLAALTDVRQGGPDSQAFAVRWSGCGRRVGRAALVLPDNEAQRLIREGLPLVPAGWGRDEAARGLLLLAALEGRPAAAGRVAVERLYRQGEMREQQAIVRMLGHLPAPAQYAELASEAVRSNVVSVLEALACDNPFPAAHMPALGFDQMIMKAIFNGLPLDRVAGLQTRNTPELRRMVEGYASERRAAGRPVPADLGLILGG
jgi:hypothetical protein